MDEKSEYLRPNINKANTNKTTKEEHAAEIECSIYTI